MELADDCSESRLQPASADAKPAHGSSLTPDRLKVGLQTYTSRTLRAELKFRGALPADDVIALGLKLTSALAHLPAHGLVHRDVKPSNILFINGEPKLADAGLVAAVDDARSLVGTAGYIAPEGPGTPQADLYALGKVLYETAFGKDRQEFPALPADVASRPDHARLLELNAVLLRACETNPRDRYPNATALLADLERFHAGQSVKRRHAMERGWRWTWKAVLVFAVLALAYWLIRSERSSRATSDTPYVSPAAESGAHNAAAWEARERAVVMGSGYTAAALTNAIQEFERALSLDPDYALAWVGLSSRFFVLDLFGYAPGRETLPRAQECALKAVGLDPAGRGAAGGYFMLGECILAADYDIARAEPLFRKGVQLAPDSPGLRLNLAGRIWPYGRFDEAERILKQVIHEIPWEGSAYTVLGQAYSGAHRLPEALAALGDAIRLKPDRPEAFFERATVFWATNHRPEAARDWLRFVELSGFVCLTPATDATILNKALIERGPEGFLRQLIELLEQGLARGRFVSAYDLARLQAQLGNKMRALEYLEQAVDEHRPLTLGAKVNPAFKDLHDEPRFHAVLRRLKLEK